MHACQTLFQLWTIPCHRLQLEPNLLIPILQIPIEEAHSRPPFLNERYWSRVHLSLPGDEPLGKAFQDAQKQVLHRTEVVMDQPMVGTCFLGESPSADV